MIKQTLYFSNPAYLKVKMRQLCIQSKGWEGLDEITRPIEDIGMVILDHPQITITHNCLKALQANNTVVVSCDDKRMPHSIFLPLVGHSLQSERYRVQLAASKPLLNNMWQQTIVAKIENQRAVLEIVGKPYKRLEVLATRVTSGDRTNVEGQAAAYYWPQLFDGFIRDRYGEVPNNLLNYGYAILRSLVARALVSSGLLLTLGMHHKNQYNAFCLADDVMEPFRPFVDLLVYDMFVHDEINTFLSKESKRRLLSLCSMDAHFGKKRSPLMVGVSHTSSSLYQCYKGKRRKIKYPELNVAHYDQIRTVKQI